MHGKLRKRSVLISLFVIVMLGIVDTSAHAATSGLPAELKLVPEERGEQLFEPAVAQVVVSSPSVPAPAANSDAIMQARCAQAEYAGAPFCKRFKDGEHQ